MSTVTDPELQKKHPEYEVLAEQLPHADPDWRPITKEWGEINAQLLGVAINQALTGEKTPEEAMASIVEPVRAIMRWLLQIVHVVIEGSEQGVYYLLSGSCYAVSAVPPFPKGGSGGI